MDIRYVDIVRDKIIKGRLSSLQTTMPRRCYQITLDDVENNKSQHVVVTA